MIQTLIRRISAPLAIFLLASGLVIPIAVASEDTGSVTDFLLGAYVCPYDPGAVSVYGGTVPVDCMPVAGMSMHVVTDTLSEQFCTTSDAGSCYVSVPAESWLTITENNAARPDLVPVMNPLVTNAAAMDAVFVHVVAPVVIPEPVVISEPVVAEPVVTDPVIVEPVITDPVVTDPVVTDPVVTDPVEGEEPVVTDPVEGEEPIVTDPVVTDPIVTDPVVTDPVEGEEPVVTDPVEGEEPVVTDPVEGEEPVVTDPNEGEEPVVTDPDVPATPEIVDPDADLDDGVDTDPGSFEPIRGYVVGVGESGLICFAEAGTGSPPLHLFNEGDEVTVLSIPEDGFVQVTCGPAVGYVDAGKVSTDAPREIPVESPSGTPGATPAASPSVLESATPSAGPVGTPAATPTARTSTVAMVEETLKQRRGVEMVVAAPEGVLICYSVAVDNPPASAEIMRFANGNQFYSNDDVVGQWLPVECAGRNGYVLVQYTTAFVTQPEEPTSVEMLVGDGTERLACRTAPHSLATVITTLPAGTQFYATGPAVGGWLPIQCGGRDGYIPASMTTAVPRPPSAIKSVEMLIGTGTSRVECRSAPHVQSTVITTLPAGTAFYTTGAVVNGWLPVLCGGRDGYIPAFLTSAVPRAPRPAVSVEMLVGSPDERLACRTAPHTQATIITTIPGGTQFYVTGASVGGWLPVQCGGRDGYIPAAATSAIPRLPKPATSVEMLVGTGSTGVACRTTPHPQATVIAIMPAGTQFYATGVATNGWLPVQCGGRDGFIPATLTTVFVRPPKAATSVEMLIGSGSSGLACRTAPHPQASVISILPAGTQFYATGAAANGWLPVQCRGRDGFIPASATTAIARQPGVAIAVEMMVGSGSVVCRTSPHPQGGLIGTITINSLIPVTGSAINGWVPIQCGGRDGFIEAKYTTLVSQSLKPATGSTTIFNTGKTGTVCRTAPSMDASPITTLYEGSTVTITGSAVHSWLPVQCAGRNGYIFIVSTTIRVAHQGPAGTGRAAMVQGTGSSGLACRTVAGGSAVITTLAERTPVEVLSWANGWANIRCGGTTGYVSMRYLTFNASDPWTTIDKIWIDVNLSSQYMIVYQGDRIVGQTYVSTGRWPDFETPTGTFYIGYKIRVSDMSGCSGGECWYVPSVPYQMYFTDRGHAFHAAYWHNDFGTRRSHGCVNLPVGIAEWLYNITPVGTRVVIHY